MFFKKVKNNTFNQIFQSPSAILKKMPWRMEEPFLIQLCIAILLSLLLSLLFTPQLYTSYPDYKVGSIAMRDIKADRDFLVEDKESTEQKRLEVSKEVKSVYDYDSEIQEQLISSISRAFAMAEQSITRQNYGSLSRSHESKK